MKIYEAQLRVFDQNGRLIGERFVGVDGKTWEIGNGLAIIDAVTKMIVVPLTSPMEHAEVALFQPPDS